MAHVRIAQARLRSLQRQLPAVAILGPRQIGKSTLARSAFADFTVFDLEKPADLDRLSDDPLFVLSQHPHIILDEAQRLPALFPALRVLLDEHPLHRVVLLGSASPTLVRQISESLTGRLAIFELGPISIFEGPDPEHVWLRGGFPRLHWSKPRVRPGDWYAAYVRTTLEHDVPELGFRTSSVRLRKLLTMVAHSQGSVQNLSELGGALGVDYHSVAHLLDVFEGTFLVRRLQPYFANIGKRLVKSPKLYVRDTGMLHALLGMGFSRREVLSHPKAGASFETFCIEQIVQHALLADPGAEAFFFRTHTGVEVDLLLRLRGRLIPIEVKLGTSPPDVGNLETCMRDLELGAGFVVTLATEPIQLRRSIWMCGLRSLLERLRLRPRSMSRST